MFLWCVALTFSSSLQAKEDFGSQYERHLPTDIYLCCMNYQLIDEQCSENERSQQDSKGVHQLRIRISSYAGEQVVLIDYAAPPTEENFSGFQLGYQDRRLKAYAIFDAEGHDYVPFEPISESDEKTFASVLLDKFFPIFVNIQSPPPEIAQIDEEERF